MTTPLLSTKLYLPPVRAQQVERSRLTLYLDDLLRPGAKLALICAPAGFGKTTLLADWLGGKLQDPRPKVKEVAEHERLAALTFSAARCDVAWLALDAADNDPARFWAYVIAALDGVVPGIAAPTLALLHASQPLPLETILTTLLNGLNKIASPIVLALDDYHVIETRAIHDTLTFFLDHMPQQLRLVIASRADPPLPIARWRARGDLTELRAIDLRFTRDETATFLREASAVALTLAEIAALDVRTEGWIAGLHLAALALRDRPDVESFIRAFTGSHRFVLDYLAEEVLERLSPQLYTFVLRTSILGRLCGSLCEALVADGLPILASELQHPQHPASARTQTAQTLLEQLERANLFLVSLDGERRWYRYHHLFGEVLREHLRSHVSPAEIRALHQQASSWYAQNGWLSEAIQHAFDAEDPAAAAHLLEAWGHRLIALGEIVSLVRWLRMLPETSLHTRPRLLLLLAWVLPNTGALGEVAHYLQEAEALLAENPDPVLRSELLATQLAPLIYREQTAEVIALGREVLEHLPVEHFFHSLTAVITGLALIRRDQLAQAVQMLSYAATHARKKQELFFLIPSLALLADIAAERGDFAQAERLYDQALAASQGPNGTRLPIAGMALVGLGRLRCWQGRWEAGARAFEEGLELCIQINAAAHFFLDGYTGLADLKLAQEQPAAALQLLALAEERARPFANPAFMDKIAAHRAAIWLAQADPALLPWLHERRLHQEDPLMFVREKEYLTLVRALLATNELAEAVSWIDRLTAFARDTGRVRSEVDLLLLAALAYQYQGNRQAEHAARERALSLAAPIGYVIQAAGRELRVAEPAALPFALTAQPVALAEALSERELEVLRLIAAGRSNQEIADTLIIALTTVKKHINNIYGKLEVRSRTQALLRARERNLV